MDTTITVTYYVMTDDTDRTAYVQRFREWETFVDVDDVCGLDVGDDADELDHHDWRNRVLAVAEAAGWPTTGTEQDNGDVGAAWAVDLDPAAAILAHLEAYQGDNVWEDVIRSLPRYDDDATDVAYSQTDSGFVLTDGTHIEYDAQKGRWIKSVEVPA